MGDSLDTPTLEDIMELWFAVSHFATVSRRTERWPAVAAC
jgi:hypothetical protein